MPHRIPLMKASGTQSRETCLPCGRSYDRSCGPSISSEAFCSVVEEGSVLLREARLLVSVALLDDGPMPKLFYRVA